MNEQNKSGFEPPVMTVLTSVFNQDTVGDSALVSWSIGEIPEINQ